jgi:hypothetical protein
VQIQFTGLALELLEPLLAESSFIMLHPLVDVLLPKFELAVDQTDKFVGHGGEGFGRAKAGSEAPWLMGQAKMLDVLNGYTWELYNIAEDYSQSNDLAAQMPDKVREMQERFVVEAARNNVLPLDNSVLERLLTRTPVDDRDYQVPFRFTGKLTKLTVKIEPKMLPPELVEMEKRLRQGERQN